MTGIQQVQQSCPVTTLQVGVHPIDWVDWRPNGDSDTTMYTTSEMNKTGDYRPGHYLTEMGGKTTNYRYQVYYKGGLLVSSVIKLPCCSAWDECPVGKRVLRRPCRERLRDAAMKEAYVVWVDLLRTLGAANIPPVNTGDTDTSG
jgi:hypothetical protein